MRVAAIDVATTSGYAVVEQPKGGRESVVHVGSCRLRFRSAGEVIAVVERVLTCRPELVALEAPYVGANFAAGLVLAELLGRYRQELERRMVETVIAKASQWQQGILAGLATPHSRRVDRKGAAQTWARVTFGLEVGEDEADAIGLATWTLRTRRLERGRAA